MKTLVLALASSLVLPLCFAAPPAFQTPSVPEGWYVVRGEVDPGAVRSAKPAVPLELATAAPVALPMEATIRFRATQGDVVTFSLLEELKALPAKGKPAPDVKPLLVSAFRPTAPTTAIVTAQAGGEAMSTEIPSLRGWS